MLVLFRLYHETLLPHIVPICYDITCTMCSPDWVTSAFHTLYGPRPELYDSCLCSIGVAKFSCLANHKSLWHHNIHLVDSLEMVDKLFRDFLILLHQRPILVHSSCIAVNGPTSFENSFSFLTSSYRFAPGRFHLREPAGFIWYSIELLTSFGFLSLGLVHTGRPP